MAPVIDTPKPSALQLAHLGSLTSSLAHELRNPLNAIKANLQLMEEDLQREEDGEGPHTRRVRRLLGEVERLDRILSGFMAFVRGEELQFQRRDLGLLLRDVIHLITPQADAEGVTVLADADAMVEADVDAEALKQALLNLALNGLQSMQDARGRACSGATLMLRLSAVDSSPEFPSVEGPIALIDVIDTGRGIPPSEQAQIFELFYTTRDGGTGVGLAVVDRVIREHRGGIRLESEEGRGTRFHIALPRRQAARAEAVSTGVASAESGGPRG